LKVNHVSDEHVASIFTVEEYVEQEASVKGVGKQGNAGFLLGLLFDPEDGGDIFLSNVY
jgi:hypothetical protein